MLGRLARGGLAVSTLVLTLGTGATARADTAEEVNAAICAEALSGGDSAGIHHVVDPPPGASVHPGDVVIVNVSWDPALFATPSVEGAANCVTADGHAITNLSEIEGPTDNDGQFQTKFTVPDGLPPGASLCERAMVFTDGRSGGKSRTAMTCHVVARAAAAAPAPAATAVPAPASPADNRGEAAQPAAPVQPPVPVSAQPAVAAGPARRLPATGSGVRILLSLAGMAFVFGGGGIGASVGRRRPA